MSEWDIQRRNAACAACARAFAAGETHFSAIVAETPGESTSLKRLDYCLSCWPSVQGGMAPVSYWQATIPVPPDPRRENVNAARAWFEHLVRLDARDALQDKILYLLALLLLRRRRVKICGRETAEGREVLVLELPWTESQVRVYDPGISDADIASLTQELKRLLEPEEAAVS